MQPEQDQNQQLKQYRRAAADLEALYRDVGEHIQRCKQVGDLSAGQNALSELELRIEDFKKLRSSLTPQNLFLATYNVEVYGPHEVSFVLPKGVTRLDLCKEANDLVADDKTLITTIQLGAWEKNAGFTRVTEVPERVHIKAHDSQRFQVVEEQKRSLRERKLEMASFEDVVAAFAVHHVATQESLFPWIGDWEGSELIATSGGGVRFDLFCGLMFERFFDGASPAMAATRVSSRLGS